MIRRHWSFLTTIRISSVLILLTLLALGAAALLGLKTIIRDKDEVLFNYARTYAKTQELHDAFHEQNMSAVLYLLTADRRRLSEYEEGRRYFRRLMDELTLIEQGKDRLVSDIEGQASAFHRAFEELARETSPRTLLRTSPETRDRLIMGLNERETEVHQAIETLTREKEALLHRMERASVEHASEILTAIALLVAAAIALNLVIAWLGRNAVLRRVAAEEKLKASEARVRLLTNSTAEGILGCGLDGRCSFANHSALRLLGFGKEAELLGRPIQELFHQPDSEKARPNPALLALESGSPVHMDRLSILRGSDTPLSIECWSYPIRAAETAAAAGASQLLGVVTAFVDITARLRQEDRQALLNDVGRALTATLDATDTFRKVAGILVPRLADVVALTLRDDGASSSYFIGRTPQETQAFGKAAELFPPEKLLALAEERVGLNTSEPQLVARVRLEALSGLLSPGELARIGELGIRSMLFFPLKARGRRLGALALFSASESRHFDAQDLELANQFVPQVALAMDNANLYQQARTAVHAREDIIAMVSHDLKNPLSAVLMNAALLRRQLKRGAAVSVNSTIHNLDLLESAATRMHRLIGDLLDFAKIEAGKFTVEARPTPLKRILAEAKDLMTPLADAKGIMLRFEDQTPEAVLSCDADRMLQVLANLIGNSIKFTPPEGEITVHAHVEALIPYAVVRVCDTGIGMPPAELEHLFDRYWQARHSRKGGSGLGLFIAKGIVEAQGGRIWAESEPGHGATLTFTVPLGASPQTLAPS